MKKVLVAGEEYEAEKIVKTEKDIIGYINGHEVFKFAGIRNMNVFSLAGGAEWDEMELSPQEELIFLKARQDESDKAILSLINTVLMEGM